MSDQKKYTSKLAGARVLVIGGSSGLGFTAAEASLEHGATVIISSSSQSRIDSAIQRLQKSYPSLSSQISGQACDLSKEAELESNIKSLFAFATSNGANKLDHVIYTAGDPLAMMKLADATMERIKQAGMVRFFGPLMVAKHAPANMNPGPASSIILTTGSVSQKPRPDWTIVGSFATGLQGMCRGLALDLKPLRVNLISPGAVDTELWSGMPQEAREGMFKQIEQSMPTGKVGRAQDVAEAYLYLMKDWNATGSMVSTNSGSLIA